MKKVFICEECGKETEGDLREEYEKFKAALPKSNDENIALVCLDCYEKKYRDDRN